MTLVLTNLYHIGEENFTYNHLVTGIVGLFETRELAFEAYKGKLKELGIPEEEFEDYVLVDAGQVQHIEIMLDEDAKCCENNENEEKFVFQISIKDVEMNKVYHFGE